MVEVLFDQLAPPLVLVQINPMVPFPSSAAAKRWPSSEQVTEIQFMAPGTDCCDHVAPPLVERYRNDWLVRNFAPVKIVVPVDEVATQLKFKKVGIIWDAVALQDPLLVY